MYKALGTILITHRQTSKQKLMVLWSNLIYLDNNSESWCVSQELSWVPMSKWLFCVESLCKENMRADMSWVWAELEFLL